MTAPEPIRVARRQRRGFLVAIGASGAMIAVIAIVVAASGGKSGKSGNRSESTSAAAAAKPAPAPTSAIAIVTEPAGAEITVDGTPRGSAPVNVLSALPTTAPIDAGPEATPPATDAGRRERPPTTTTNTGGVIVPEGVAPL